MQITWGVGDGLAQAFLAQTIPPPPYYPDTRPDNYLDKMVLPGFPLWGHVLVNYLDKCVDTIVYPGYIMLSAQSGMLWGEPIGPGPGPALSHGISHGNSHGISHGNSHGISHGIGQGPGPALWALPKACQIVRIT